MPAAVVPGLSRVSGVARLVKSAEQFAPFLPKVAKGSEERLGVVKSGEMVRGSLP